MNFGVLPLRRFSTYSQATSSPGANAFGPSGPVRRSIDGMSTGIHTCAPRSRTPDDYASFLSSQLDDSDAVVLVAEHDGQVIGYAYAAMEGYDYMSLRGPAGLLHDVIVDPDHRGQGVGRLLVDALLSDLQSRGVPRVVLSAAERNESAQRLFERMGFRRTMVEMTRELDGPADDTVNDVARKL